MLKARAAILGLALLPLAVGALAQEEERYRLERTEDGYVRMDTRTGAMTLCQEREGELVCRPASESDDPAPAETDALRERIAALEERVEALEKQVESSVPLQEEFEQSLTLMERFFRRFIDIVRGLEEEEQPQEPAPEGGSTPAERT
ncbi:hypothetical protein NYR54_06560 [Chelativorans sp. SCAU2101]|jgi:hypothetical protein|uniref:Uncharacterized protein n=1 Tax=Chelativorans petroleitrophicus TaxID=2975484 RepID=A0A9X2X888_9HYPH|nr:hypothetical protein [Chelativorans petroleitrophicus]MCT8989956.1 hypothetical protein [Chelativorans petroleitrophicus]